MGKWEEFALSRAIDGAFVSEINYKKMRREPVKVTTYAQELFSTKMTWEEINITAADSTHAPSLLSTHSVTKVVVKKDEHIEVQPAESTSEKKEILKSFSHYVEEEGRSVGQEKEIEFARGKVTKKNDGDHIEVSSLDESLLQQIEHFDSVTNAETKPLVLFACERPNDVELDQEVAGDDLLSKMISAMNLSCGVGKVFLKKDSDAADLTWHNLMAYFIQNNFDHLVIVTMGAFTTNTALGKKERLSKIHGRPFEKTYWQQDVEQKLQVTLFPVFHPDILQINPNMKRSAWLDLQKVMKFVGDL